jgi:hypothetical protein
MQISFPREQQLSLDDASVDFPAIVDGNRVPCKILGEALDDYFRTETAGPLHAFLKHRRVIEGKARELIEKRESQLDGSILIRS